MTGPDHDPRGKIPDSLATERNLFDAHTEFESAFTRFFKDRRPIVEAHGRIYRGGLRVPRMAERISISCGNEDDFGRKTSALSVSVRYILGFDPDRHIYEDEEVRTFPQIHYAVPDETTIAMTDERYALTMAEVRSHMTPEEAAWVDKLIEESQKKHAPERMPKLIDDLLDEAPDSVPIQTYDIYSTDITYFNNGTWGRAERIVANKAYFDSQSRPKPSRSLFMETPTGERYVYKEWQDRPSEMSIAPNTLEERDLLLQEGCVVDDEPFTFPEHRIHEIQPSNAATLRRFTRVLTDAIDSGIQQPR